ncbi:MAG: hypothetical protein V4507_11845 [Verrucomicrobiota bacterium]
MSTINSVSSSGVYANPPQDSRFSQRKQAFDSLTQAINSGDISAAQTAYAQLQKLQNGGSSSQDSHSNDSSKNPGAQDFEALGTALKSGDLNAAKEALTKLQQDIKTKGPHRGHHHKPPANGDQEDGASPSSTSSSSSTESDLSTYLTYSSSGEISSSGSAGSSFNLSA